MRSILETEMVMASRDEKKIDFSGSVERSREG